MALTKIFTGMAQGPETIDANFNDINGRIPDKGDYYNKTEVDGKITDANVDTGWVKVALTNAIGDVFIRKIGKHVMMRGLFKTTVTSSVTNQLGLVYNLPDEFRSTTSYSPIIELTGPWDPHNIIIQVACNTGTICQIGGVTNTNVDASLIRWEVD